MHAWMYVEREVNTTLMLLIPVIQNVINVPKTGNPIAQTLKG